MNRYLALLLSAGLFFTSCDLESLKGLLGDDFNEMNDDEPNDNPLFDEEYLEQLSGEAVNLVYIYESAGGEDWKNSTNWCTDKPLNEWHGIETDAEGNVVSIDLSDNNLKGHFTIELSAFKSLTTININGNSLECLELHGESDTFKNLNLSRCVTDRISFNYIDDVIISGCDSLTNISGRCKNLEVTDTDFRYDASTPFGVEAENAVIRNCNMHSCGVSSENLRFEDSSTYDTWFCNTRVRLDLVNCYCSTICGGDFYEETIINMENATLWQSNWDSESLKTFNCTITGSQWDSLFE